MFIARSASFSWSVRVMAKNGILIIKLPMDCAITERKSPPQFANAFDHSAASGDDDDVAFSTVLGAVPLILASGAGAESHLALGWVIIGGLGFATFFTLFLTPRRPFEFSLHFRSRDQEKPGYLWMSLPRCRARRVACVALAEADQGRGSWEIQL